MDRLGVACRRVGSCAVEEKRRARQAKASAAARRGENEKPRCRSGGKEKDLAAALSRGKCRHPAAHPIAQRAELLIHCPIELCGFSVE